jgi:HlyD family secretion protein
VKIGKRNGLDAQVLEGLSEGDIVIVHPSDRVADGVEVVPR